MNRLIPGVFFILVIGVSLVAFFPVLEAFFSKRISRTRRIIDDLPGRSFWVGLANFIFALILLFALFGLGRAIGRGGERVLVLLSPVILVPLAIGLMLGLAAVVRVAGERLLPEKGSLARSIWATAALIAACSLPFVGWFILLPYVCFLGLGAFVLGLFSKQPETVETVPVE